MSITSTTPTRVDTSHSSEDLRRLAELVEDIDIAALVTVRPDGRVHSRPMATQGMTQDGTFEFLTSRSSLKIAEIGQSGHVNLTYVDNKHMRYVSVSGVAEAVKDDARVEELWSPAMQAWFSGPDDPDICLLRVHPTDAEYWDSPHGKVVTLLQVAAKAIRRDGGGADATADDPASHGTLDLS